MSKQSFLLKKKHYLWLLLSFLLMIFGFVIMAYTVAPSNNAYDFDKEQLFSFVSTKLSAFLVILGYVGIGLNLYSVLKTNQY